MLESVTAFLKTLPHWLMVTAEVLIVAVVFLTAMTFLAGVWCGLRIIGQRHAEITSVELWPPRIVFGKRDT